MEEDRQRLDFPGQPSAVMQADDEVDEEAKGVRFCNT